MLKFIIRYHRLAKSFYNFNQLGRFYILTNLSIKMNVQTQKRLYRFVTDKCCVFFVTPNNSFGKFVFLPNIISYIFYNYFLYNSCACASF